MRNYDPVNYLRWASVAVFFTAATYASSCAATPPLLGVQQMAGGWYHTCAIVNGAVQCWGYNDYGQLGNPTLVETGRPTPVTTLGTGATDLTARYLNTCAIVHGIAKCWGDNSFGQLGNGTYDFSFTPVTVLDGRFSPQLSPLSATAIASGNYHTCAISGGAAVCWGDNQAGELGNGQSGNGLQNPLPVPVSILTSGVTAIAGGLLQSCAIYSGEVYCWGGYSSSQFMFTGVPSPIVDPDSGSGSPLLGGTAIAVGGDFDYDHLGLFNDEFACFVFSGGARCNGDDDYGELGNGTTTSAPGFNQVSVNGLASGVTAIATGSAHACALVNNDPLHPVKCWGSNSRGQLGNASTTDSSAPVDVAFSFSGSFAVNSIMTGGWHSCALVTASGTTKMYCWGDDTFGQLGLVASDSQKLFPTPVFGLGTGVTGISTGAGDYHACAIVGGGVECWGANDNGELGDGSYFSSTRPVAVASISGVTAVTTGEGHSCAIANDGAYCWGSDLLHQSGYGASPVAVSGLSAGVTAISAGAAFTCAVQNGGAQCWGDNTYGQLGNIAYPTTGSNVPVPVSGLTAGVTAISANSYDVTYDDNDPGAYPQSYSSNVCALVPSPTPPLTSVVLCWGSNNYGQLGNSSYPNGSGVPVPVTDLSSGVSAIAVGGNFACAIVTQGSLNNGVECWGDNEYGQLGNPAYAPSSDIPVPVTGLSSGVTTIMAGSSHACAIVNGGVKCWGLGPLGDGSSGVRTAPVAVAGLSSGVVALGGSYNYTCATTSGGALQCWGDDTSGQLGDGRILYETTPQVVVQGDIIFQDGFDE